MPAFTKHFDRLNARYGEVMIVNLLADRGNEAPLKKAYRDHYEQLGSSVIAYEELDFHAENAVSPSALSEALSRLAAQHDNLLDPNVSLRQTHTNETVLLHSQNGIFRTNCKGETIRYDQRNCLADLTQIAWIGRTWYKSFCLERLSCAAWHLSRDLRIWQRRTCIASCLPV